MRVGRETRSSSFLALIWIERREGKIGRGEGRDEDESTELLGKELERERWEGEENEQIDLEGELAPPM